MSRQDAIKALWRAWKIAGTESEISEIVSAFVFIDVMAAIGVRADELPEEVRRDG